MKLHKARDTASMS